MELSNREVLLLDVSRSLAGFWLLSRAHTLPDDSREVEGPSRTAALLFKKHLEGARIEELGSEPARILTLVTAKSRVILRPWGAPGGTLVTGGLAVVGTIAVVAATARRFRAYDARDAAEEQASV